MASPAADPDTPTTGRRSRRPARQTARVNALDVSHRSTVTSDQIDDLGHMNVRHYGANAGAGTRTVCERLGLGTPRLRSAYTRHHHEQLEGNDLEVRSAVLPDGDRLRVYHELRNRADGDLAATFVHELDHPPVDAPAFELPAHGMPRSLRLDTDALATAPSLAQVRELDLADRKPRQVDTDDTLGGETVPPANYAGLLWGGERLAEEDSWIRTLPDGGRYSFVVMEQRVWIRPKPIAVGTPIQSFRASLEVGEKIGRDIGWCFDTDTGEPLVVFEAIDLCFNLTERRSMAIPAGSRSPNDPSFHPELAPGVVTSGVRPARSSPSEPM